VVTPSSRREAPPPLDPDYPQSDRPASARWGTSMDEMIPGGAAADRATHTHKIVDGDTLPALAERYLGAASRAREIFEANREVLVNPELLPIGVELKIPPRGRRSEPAPPSAPLAPVPHERR
jgi:nucleoid-associated protein YgaU